MQDESSSPLPSSPTSIHGSARVRLRQVEELVRGAERIAGIVFARDDASAARFVDAVLAFLAEVDDLASTLLVECSASRRPDWFDVECLAFMLGFRARRDRFLLGPRRPVDAVAAALAAASALSETTADLATLAHDLARSSS